LGLGLVEIDERGSTLEENAKLKAWENFYNYDRPHISHEGKTPYEVMKSLLE